MTNGDGGAAGLRRQAGSDAGVPNARMVYFGEFSSDQPGRVDAPGVHVHRAGLYDLFRGYDACRGERSTWGSWRM